MTDGLHYTPLFHGRFDAHVACFWSIAKLKQKDAVSAVPAGDSWK